MRFSVHAIICFLLIFSFSSCLNLIKPSDDFEYYIPPQKPDYSNENNWASLPSKKDKADLVPTNSGLKENQDNALVDVFFVHPTTYYGAQSWNGDVNNKRLNDFTDKTTIMHQASVFNESCKIYAPRYRQATLYSFMDSKDNGEKALKLAYSDVKDAFNYYLTHYNKGRPFIIASHSQGTRHAVKLIHEIIENDTALLHRMVAAYIIGMKIEPNDITIIKPCNSPTETNCFVTWNTVARGGENQILKAFVCTNPLTWKTDTTYAGFDKNLGGIPGSFDRVDIGITDAQVINGYLNVTKPDKSGYHSLGKYNYHIMDYNFFYMNIRENVKQRISSYFEHLKK